MKSQAISIENKITRATERIIKGYSPQKIIMFGSCARGDNHEGSDLDLIIIKNTEDEFLKRLDDVLDCCTGEIGVEPLVYTESEIKRMRIQGNDFIETALEEGKVVYEKQQSA